MPQPHRRLPDTRKIPWAELRRAAVVTYAMLRAGWDALTAAEREEVRQLLTKSRGRPRNLTRDETRRLGRLAARAASAAGRTHRR
jgi:hypothetical protein